MNNMDKKIQYIVAVVVAVVIGGGAFYGGMAYAKNKVASQRSSFQGMRMGGRFAAGNNFVGGTVVAKDAQSITIKDRSGNSRIIFYSGTTDVGKFVQGTVDDLAVGKTVMVNGKTNSDGSITAQSIQIRPMLPTPTTSTPTTNQ